MTLIVSCGMQPEWCLFAEDRMVEMGMKLPAPALRSGLTSQDFTDRMCASQGVSLPWQAPIEALSLGKAWDIAASDLVVSNADNGLWGWADPRHIFFLDFWKAFEPSCKFILVYGTPAQALTQRLTDVDLAPEGITDILEQWAYYHEALLRFYQIHRDSSILVHISAFENTAQDITQLLEQRFDLPMRRLNKSKNLEVSQLESLIAMHAVDKNEVISMTLAELNNSADLPAGIVPLEGQTLSSTAMVELKNLRETASKLSELDGINASLLSQIKVLQDDLIVVSEEKTHYEILENKLTKMSENREKEIKAELHQSQDENALLNLQLQQVREELELYFKLYQGSKNQSSLVPAFEEAASNRVNGLSSSSLRSAIQIDMRAMIEGEGWHSAEAHGRWAGFAPISSVRVPPFKGTPRKIEIKVVDSITPEHLENLSLNLNGIRLRTKLKILSNLEGLLSIPRRFRARLQRLEKPFPVIVSAEIPSIAEVDTGDDSLLEFVYPPAVSPAQTGGSDTRKLSVCVETLRIFERA